MFLVIIIIWFWKYRNAKINVRSVSLLRLNVVVVRVESLEKWLLVVNVLMGIMIIMEPN